MPPHLANFVFLVEMGFLHVDQAGLELLTSGDPPSLASQSAEITGLNHSTWRLIFIGHLGREGTLLGLVGATKTKISKYLTHLRTWEK